MLSASTISSSSSAYSSNAGMSTPSQYSSDSRRGNGNPLTELIETEQSYIETLKMIDSVCSLKKKKRDITQYHD